MDRDKQRIHYQHHNSADPLWSKPYQSISLSIIIGNFNGHSHLWDHVQPPDAWGDKITDWIINKDLHDLSDGSAARTSRIFRNDSTPDLSLCSCNWSTKTSWSLAEPIDSSDHLSISITINHRIRYQPVVPRKARLRCNGVDWSSLHPHFMSAEPNQVRNRNLGSIHTSEQRSATATTSAVLFIKTGRNRLMPVKKRMSSQAKANSWKDLLHSSKSNADGPDVWKVIQGLNGTPDTNSPNEAMSHNGRTITDTSSKANIFINHYDRISKLHMTKEDPDLNCHLKQRLNAPSVDNKSCTSINMLELPKVLLVQATFHQHSSNHLAI